MCVYMCMYMCVCATVLSCEGGVEAECVSRCEGVRGGRNGQEHGQGGVVTEGGVGGVPPHPQHCHTLRHRLNHKRVTVTAWSHLEQVVPEEERTPENTAYTTNML